MGQAEAAVLGVEAALHLFHHRREVPGVQLCRLRGDEHVVLRQVVDHPLYAAAVVVVDTVHRFQHFFEGGQAAHRLAREISAAVERLPVGREEDRERPAALPGQRLHSFLVAAVDLRPVVPVHLDGHEVAVDERRRLRVLPCLPGHHVAPVAPYGADGK